jgi:hypothetical protein
MEMDNGSLDFMHRCWSLFLGRFGPQAKKVVDDAEGPKGSGSRESWFGRAEVVDVVNDWDAEQGPANVHESISEPVVAPDGPDCPEQQHIMSPKCRAVVCHQDHVCMVWVATGELSVCSLVVVAPNVHVVVWKHLFGPSTCVDVAVDVVVMWLVRNCHCAVVLGSSPVFSSSYFVDAVGPSLDDGEHVRGKRKFNRAIDEWQVWSAADRYCLSVQMGRRI